MMQMRRAMAALAIGLLALCGASAQSAPQTQDEVLALALRVSPGIAAARQRVLEAESRVAELSGQRHFQVSLEGTLSASNGRIADPPALQTFGTAEASLVAPFPNLGRVGAQIEQAQQQLLAIRAQLARAQLDVEFKANQAFIELWRAREALSIAEENLAQATRQADDTQKRISAGDVPAADLLKAQVPVAQSRAALARAKIAVSVATQNLNDILQRDLDLTPSLAQPAMAPPTAITADRAVSYAMDHSPDILEAQANLLAAKANVRFVRHARDTEFSLQLTHTRTSDITSDSYLTTLALTFSLPISDGGVAGRQLKQAESQAAQAETALKVAKQSVRLAVEQGLLDVEGDEANATATTETEQIAKDSLDKARLSYDSGLSTTRDVLDAQLIYSQARVEANSARYDLSISRARLKQLMGGSQP